MIAGMEDVKVKQVLLTLVAEIEFLRTTLLATTSHPSLKMSMADAQDATNLAKKELDGRYEKLRKEIESL